MTAKSTRSPAATRKRTIAGRKLANFQKEVVDFFAREGRTHLPWRNMSQSMPPGKRAYRILVSEVMLQQTQVARVIPYYRAFLTKFPTVKALAEAPLSEVLRAWQGLGYNRRAKMLHDAAKITMINHSGRIPRSYEALSALPGVGEYTAKAVRVFAYHEPEVMIETNIRAVFLHHFFKNRERVADRELIPLIEKTLRAPSGHWYAALMDYGAYLKTLYPNPSRRSAAHTTQKPFTGSDREIRGALLRAVLGGESLRALPFPRERVMKLAGVLVREGMLVKRRGRFDVRT